MVHQVWRRYLAQDQPLHRAERLQQQERTRHMSTEDLLIAEADRRGLGLDLNFLRGIFTVQVGRRRHKFASMLDALSWIKRENVLG
jgi:hypothetical protein